MNQKIKTQKGVIQIPLLIAIIFSITAITGIGYGVAEYNKTSKIIKEAEQLSKEEKYNEAIGKLELAQNKLFDKMILKQKINTELDTNKKLLEDKSKYNQGLDELDKGNLQEAIDLLSELLENSFYYQKAQTKIEEAKRKIIEEELSKKQIVRKKAESKAKQEEFEKKLKEQQLAGKEAEKVEKWKYYMEEVIPQVKKSIAATNDIKNKTNEKISQFQNWIDKEKALIKTLKYTDPIEARLLIEVSENYVVTLKDLLKKTEELISLRQSIIKAINNRDENLLNRLINQEDKLVEEFKSLVEKEKEVAIKANAVRDTLVKLLSAEETKILTEEQQLKEIIKQQEIEKQRQLEEQRRKMDAILTALQEEVNKRNQRRLQDLQKLTEINKKYQQLIEQGKTEIEQQIEALKAEYRAKGIDPDNFNPFLRGEAARLQDEYNRKVIYLWNQSRTDIENYDMKRRIEIEKNWPVWASPPPITHLPSTYLPKIELFEPGVRFITIETHYGSFIYKVIPKPYGGYYISGSEETFEITPMDDGRYYISGP